MTTYLIAGCLLLGMLALVALVVAIARAKDGYENESGFHSVAQNQPAGASPQPNAAVSAWNQIEGVSFSEEETEEARLWNWEQYQESECDRASRAPFPTSFV